MSGAPTTRPPSDVSPGVGLAGLAGLAAWILVCRHWPAIADAFAIPGPRAPLAGPYAAVASLLFTSLPMIAWSLLVDKVHRNPSTGIDWSLRRPIGETLEVSITKLAGLWATWVAIGCFYCLARWYWRGPYLFAMEVIGALAVAMVVLSIPYVIWLDRRLREPRDGAWHVGAMLIGREAWSGAEVARHARAWAIKAFFGAFMISILPPGFATLVTADFGAIASDPVRLAMIVIEALFVIDVQIGAVGYLLTLRPLDAHIRSANPLLAGWVAALLCYPPFVWGVMGRADVMGYQANVGGWALWMDGQTVLLWGWAALLVFLTAIYAWATFAFGIRFSNLTYRGVLTNGPYRFTRHPAYLSKNLFWWCSTLPFLVTNGSIADMVRNTAMLAAVGGIYYWRARTEEAHLLAEDAKYRAYHAWAAEHAPVTRILGRLLARIRAQLRRGQPAARLS